LIEDLHSCLNETQTNLHPDIIELACILVDFSKTGITNVIYTTSDYNCISYLRAVSGHSSQLKARIFPEIPDQQLKTQLKNLVYYNVNGNTVVDFISNISSIREYHFVFGKDEKISNEIIDEVVNKIGSRMAHLMTCINGIIMKKSTARESINQIIRDEELKLLQLFDGTLIKIDMDMDIIISYAFTIFETILEKKEKIPDDNPTIQQLFKNNDFTTKNELYLKLESLLARKFLATVLDQLVKANILCYIDRYVIFYTRSTREAYKNIRNDTLLKNNVNQAMNALKKQVIK